MIISIRTKCLTFDRCPHEEVMIRRKWVSASKDHWHVDVEQGPTGEHGECHRLNDSTTQFWNNEKLTNAKRISHIHGPLSQDIFSSIFPHNDALAVENSFDKCSELLHTDWKPGRGETNASPLDIKWSWRGPSISTTSISSTATTFASPPDIKWSCWGPWCVGEPSAGGSNHYYLLQLLSKIGNYVLLQSCHRWEAHSPNTIHHSLLARSLCGHC